MALKEIAQKLWRRAKLLLLAAVRALYESHCPGTLDAVTYVFHKFKRRRLDPDESGADKQPDLETGGGGRFGQCRRRFWRRADRGRRPGRAGIFVEGFAWGDKIGK